MSTKNHQENILNRQNLTWIRKFTLIVIAGIASLFLQKNVDLFSDYVNREIGQIIDTDQSAQRHRVFIELTHLKNEEKPEFMSQLNQNEVYFHFKGAEMHYYDRIYVFGNTPISYRIQFPIFDLHDLLKYSC